MYCQFPIRPWTVLVQEDLVDRDLGLVVQGGETGIGLADHAAGALEVTARPSVVDCGAQLTLQTRLHDPEGVARNFHWNCTHGTFLSGNIGRTAIWQAPPQAGSFVITVRAADYLGQTVSEGSVSVVVRQASESPLPVFTLASMDSARE
jgi:hypothetical protein